MRSTRFVLQLVIWIWILYREYVVCKLCNVALCRPTIHSTLDGSFSPEKAGSCNGVDGNRNLQTCVHPERGELNFVQVDLGAEYTISHIDFWGLQDNVYLEGLQVYTGRSLKSNGLLNNFNTGDLSPPCKKLQDVNPSSRPLRVICDMPPVARYVQIIREDDPADSTAFCELEIYADVPSERCPDPIMDWACRNLSHTSNDPRAECIDNFQHTTVLTTHLTTEDLTSPKITSQTTENINSQTTIASTVSSDYQTTSEHLTSDVHNHITTSNNDNTVSTTQSIPTNTQTNSTCFCPCSSGGFQTFTDEELQQKIQEIIAELKIDPKETSVAKRKLISVPDSRPSAKAVGSVGVVILLTVVGLVILMDANVIHENISKCWNKRRKIGQIEEEKITE